MFRIQSNMFFSYQMSTLYCHLLNFFYLMAAFLQPQKSNLVLSGSKSLSTFIPCLSLVVLKLISWQFHAASREYCVCSGNASPKQHQLPKASTVEQWSNETRVEDSCVACSAVHHKKILISIHSRFVISCGNIS